ncbi:hypothetical protein PI125_g20182 [Phytophthora idaei]|nr:hypothetical protein PI125_g20182 [Phytophthora idaei]
MEKAAGVAIWKLASMGRLDLIQRIVELYPPPWMDLEQWVFKDWYDAIKMACSGGHLDVVQWLVEHPNGQQAYLRQQSGQQILVWVAAGNGHVAVMEYIYDHWRTGNSPSIVIPLASSVAAIKWLIDHYPSCVRQTVTHLVKNAAKLGATTAFSRTCSRILTATTSPSKYLFGRFSANRAARIYCKRLRRLFACLKNTTQLNDMDAKI